MKLEDKIVNMVYDDMHEFLITRKNWAKHKAKGQYIAYGLLNKVFEVIFGLAPTKESAIEVISMSLINFLDKEKEMTNKNNKENQNDIIGKILDIHINAVTKRYQDQENQKDVKK